MADNWSITSMLETVRTLTLAVIKNWYETNVMNTEDVDALIRYVSGYPSYTDQRHPVGRGSRSAEECGLTTAARAVMLDNLEDPTVIRTLSSLLAANPLFLNSDILPVASRAFEEFCGDEARYAPPEYGVDDLTSLITEIEEMAVTLKIEPASNLRVSSAIADISERVEELERAEEEKGNGRNARTMQEDR